jgi:hypothetical protein
MLERLLQVTFEPPDVGRAHGARWVEPEPLLQVIAPCAKPVCELRPKSRHCQDGVAIDVACALDAERGQLGDTRLADAATLSSAGEFEEGLADLAGCVGSCTEAADLAMRVFLLPAARHQIIIVSLGDDGLQVLPAPVADALQLILGLRTVPREAPGKALQSSWAARPATIAMKAMSTLTKTTSPRATSSVTTASPRLSQPIRRAEVRGGGPALMAASRSWLTPDGRPERLVEDGLACRHSP